MTSEVCIHCIPSFCEKVCFFFFGIEVHIHSKICCKVEPEGLKVLISNEQPGLGRCCPDGVPGIYGPRAQNESDWDYKRGFNSVSGDQDLLDLDSI